VNIFLRQLGKNIFQVAEPICDSVVGESVLSLHQVRLQGVFVQLVVEMFQAEVTATQLGQLKMAGYQLHMGFFEEETAVHR
jgi:hypothetical protein